MKKSPTEQDWQSALSELIRETYAKQGFGDVLIMIGCTKGENIYTQVCYPGDTATDFDLRNTVFALNNHLFSEYNAIENDTNES